ncbi:glutamate--tRNA ligase [Nitrospira sp.]|nr:glutamate--tRNA ligase [Nitrospira sp.]
MHPVRVRFAPSPTGFLHIGGVRTALFNWLYAQRHNGKFVLRIEDTDQSRSTEDSIKAILEGLEWVGLNWDVGPFRQTERLELYREHAFSLFRQGKAYWCVCKPDELDARRKEAEAKGLSPRYDGRCRSRGITNPVGDAALRFLAPQQGQTVVDDLIKGRVVFEHDVLDDLIILRSNGIPTYNFSVVVDDALMGITHVVRGDDHLTNTPRQIPIFEALGFPLPRFAHLPMILGSDKTRLSKRHGATSIMAYKEMGYLPDAMINYLARLGWSCGDQEIFSTQELIEKFSFDHVQKSAAVFNPDKLLWVNEQHIKHGDPSKIADALLRLLKELQLHGLQLPAGLHDEIIRFHLGEVPSETVAKAIPVVRDRTKTLLELAHWISPYLDDAVAVEDQAAKKYLTRDIASVLEELTNRFAAIPDFSASVWEATFKTFVEEKGMKMGQVAQPVRVALTGRTASPGLFEVMELLGRERTLLRLRKGVERARAAA